MIKQEGLYQNKVTVSLASIFNCKMAYLCNNINVLVGANSLSLYKTLHSFDIDDYKVLLTTPEPMHFGKEF